MGSTLPEGWVRVCKSARVTVDPQAAAVLASLRSRSPEDTAVVARAVASVLRPGDVVLLVGDLGAGKTTFTKALALALGVDEQVTSPTFTIMRQHDAVLAGGIATTLLHLDAYRLESADDVEDLGLLELLDGGAVAVIEWGDIVAAAFGADPLAIGFGWVDDDERDLVVSAHPSSAWPSRLQPALGALGALASGGAA